MTQETISSDTIWTGGSGNVGAASNWITGYVANIGPGGSFGIFERWTYGLPSSNQYVYLLSALSALGVSKSSVGTGGTLTGSLTSNGLIIDSSAQYLFDSTLNGESLGVALPFSGGTITNLAGGHITAPKAIAVFGGPGTVVNAGHVTGTGSYAYGIYLYSGGSVTNQQSGIIDVSASTSGSGIYIKNGTGTVTNAGTVDSGVWLGAGGVVTNESTGKIVSSNDTDRHYGVALHAGGSVTNAGRISGVVLGVGLDNGGVVINQAGGTITGTYIGVLQGIIETGTDVFIDGGGSVFNNSGATINGDIGILAGGNSATVTNAGTIAGTLAGTVSQGGITLVVGAGVSMDGGGAVANQSSGAITGASYGVYISGGPGTVTNLGTISGTVDAVKFGAGQTDTLVADPGAVFNGDVQIGSGGTLEASGTFTAGDTVSFAGTGPGTLILDDPTQFQGTIAAVAAGDQIILPNADLVAGDTIIAATIGNLSGVQTLQILQSPDGQSTDAVAMNIPIDAAENNGSLSGNYFQVVSGGNGADTILTLTQGNPVALAVNAPAAWQAYDVDGSGITIGVISDSFNTLGGEASDQATGALPSDVTILPGLGGVGTDEGRAMAQIVHDIAPGAAIDFATDGGDLATTESSIEALLDDGCQIIVDDVGFSTSTDGNLDTTIDQVVQDGVTYITAAGNDRPTTPIYGHRADPYALTVAAMNILATPDPPSTVGGYISPAQTEPFSSIGANEDKPNITGPDGGPTTFPLVSNPASSGGTGLDEFFGTSAAAPAVAAVAALMMDENPLLENHPLDLDQLIEDSATVFLDPSAGPLGVTPVQTEGAGLVNADAAVAAAADFTLCFCAGTAIGTPSGELPIERLAVGDFVLTHTGCARPIVWIGTGRVLATRGRRTAATPVIVRKSAFADNVPQRDLRVTKGHAFYIDEVLIPIEFLVNHRSIVWDDHAQVVELYHVELETHDVLLANGALAESYRDDGNRWLFLNANLGWVLPPQEPCAPVLTGGPLVDSIWRRLLDRAGPRNRLPLTVNPDLHLLVDDRRVDSEWSNGLAHRFSLQDLPKSVRIVSRAGVPAEFGLARDQRCLGIALRQLVVRRGSQFRTIEASSPELTEGFHSYEVDNRYRWTNGNAALPAAFFGDLVGPLELVLHVGDIAHYIDDGDVCQAA